MAALPNTSELQSPQPATQRDSQAAKPWPCRYFSFRISITHFVPDFPFFFFAEPKKAYLFVFHNLFTFKRKIKQQIRVTIHILLKIRFDNTCKNLSSLSSVKYTYY